jgi:hypothetical protein
LKFTKSCKNASKNEIYLQEIYQSSNQEMFAISLSSCSRYSQLKSKDTEYTEAELAAIPLFFRCPRATSFPRAWQIALPIESGVKILSTNNLQNALVNWMGLMGCHNFPPAA